MTIPLQQVRLSARERDGIRRATVTACRETSAAWKRIFRYVGD